MKLPKFLQRKSEDEEDLDDAFDDEDFDETPKTRVLDDDLDLYDESDDSLDAGSGNRGDIGDVDDMDRGGDAPPPPVEEGPPAAGDHLSDIDIDAMFGDDEEEDDDEEDEDYDDEEDGDRRRKIMFIGAGALVLVAGILGGAGFWFFSGGDEDVVAEAEAEAEKRPGGGVSIDLALPAAKGNAGGALSPPRKDDPNSLNAALSRGDSAQAAEETQDQEGADEAAEAVQPAQPAQQTALSSTLGAGSLNARAGKGQTAGQGIIIPSVTSVSFQKITDQQKVVPLASAPDKELLERQAAGTPFPLPKVGPDGRLPWQVYSRPFASRGSNPRVGILVVGLGLSRAATMAAIKKLPGEVSLVFSPYAKNLNDWLLRARLSGHEVFLELPLESRDFPLKDAGPLALSTAVQVTENLQRLKMVLGSFTGYVGVVTSMGSKFNVADGQLKPVLQEIKDRGLMFVDGGVARSEAPRIAAEIQLPKAVSNVILDEPPSRRSMDKKLKSLEGIIKQQATAIAIVHAYPSSLERLVIWTRTLEQRKLTLAPVSAIADKQFIE